MYYKVVFFVQRNNMSTILFGVRSFLFIMYYNINVRWCDWIKCSFSTMYYIVKLVLEFYLWIMTESELCRLCAETKENFIGIYEAEGQKLAIEAKIAKCLQIQVKIVLPLLFFIIVFNTINLMIYFILFFNKI